MKIVKIVYDLDDLEDEEEFINNVFIGLKQYEKTHSDFKFRLTYDDKQVEVKTLSMNESAN